MRHRSEGGGWNPFERGEEDGKAVEDWGGGVLLAWSCHLLIASLHLAILAVTQRH